MGNLGSSDRCLSALKKDRSHIQAITEPEDDLLLEKVNSSTSVSQESS